MRTMNSHRPWHLTGPRALTFHQRSGSWVVGAALLISCFWRRCSSSMKGANQYEL